jgi:CRP-like cAMP-binding protein
VPGGRAAVIDTLGPGDLLGWGWLFPPHRWHLGATAASHVAALEFDAEALRAEFAGDPAFGHAVVLVCAQVIGERLAASRRRLLDLYGPHGAGTH